MNSFQVRALDLAQAFTEHVRSDGSTFYALPDSAPQWMTDTVRACHHEELPNDWRFSMVRQLSYSLAECDSAEAARDAALDIASDASSFYHSHLLAWYAERPGRLSYVDNWAEDHGIASVEDGIGAHLMVGQTYCIEQMLHCIIDTCETRAAKLAEV